MAIISKPLIDSLFVGYNNSFQEGLKGADQQYQTIATTTKSTSKSETYGWLGKVPSLKEWIGRRVVESIANHGYSIKNKKFETTVGVDRVDIEDDNISIYLPLFEEMGRAAGVHGDELCFDLLSRGDQILCYDGQNYFDPEHPIYANVDGTGAMTKISNITDGTGPAWFVLDCSRAIKPVIYQERIPHKLTEMTKEDNEAVFMDDVYTYGDRWRGNVGFSFWQFAHMSKSELTPDSLWDTITKMREVPGDGGKKLAIKPTHLVVPPSMEKQATRMLERELESASSNELKGRLQLLVADYL